MYLFYLTPRNPEAIIRKNTVILLEQFAVLRRELMRQYLATLQSLKYGPSVFLHVAGTGRDLRGKIHRRVQTEK